MRKTASIIILTLLFLTILSYYHEKLLVKGQFPADAVQANPMSISWTFNTHVPGETFRAYVDVINVQGLLGFQCGFRFNPTVLQIVHVEIGGFLGSADLIVIPEPPWDNQNGIVPAWGVWQLTPDKAVSGSGHLLMIDFKINPALWPPYSGTYPGTPITMIDLTDADGDQCELALIYRDGITEITPTPDHIYDGSFTLAVVPGDVNYDGTVNINDLALIGLYWQQHVPPAPANVDINGDGIINITDLAILGLHWQQHV